MAVAEHIAEHLSVACKVPPDVLRRTNMYKVGDHLPFGMIVGESDSGKWNVPTMWDRMYGQLNISDMRKEVSEYNSKHKWTKQGLSFVPTKFGIAFTSKFMVRSVIAVYKAFDANASCRIKEVLWCTSIPMGQS